MKILIDMNLSPDWVAIFITYDIEAVHWSSVGEPGAEDSIIMQWARQNGCIVFTHDLDFGTALALTKSSGPSVIQLRDHDILPAGISATVLSVIVENRDNLIKGSLIVIDKLRARVRILPF